MARKKPIAPRPTSKITAKNQLPVPAEVREKLGIGPGSVLEWEERDGEVILRRPKFSSFEELHRSVFGDRKFTPRTAEEMDEGIADYLDQKHRYGRR